ncbi:MAG: AAA family ATPase [Lachnospiraceae bacterium]
MDNTYQWVPFYEAIADKLLGFSDKRDDLFVLMNKLSSDQPLMKYLHFEREDWWIPRNHQIDPFSVIGVMNRGTTDANRAVLAKLLADTFEVEIPAPTKFAGIPVLNNRNSFFAGVDEIWNLFELAMKAAETKDFDNEFKLAFEQALDVSGNGLAYITMGLYWIRPNVYMPLDSNSRAYVLHKYGIPAPSGNCTGSEYIDFLDNLKSRVAEQTPSLTLPEISYAAWAEKDSMTDGTGISIDAATIQSSGYEIPKNLILYGTPGTGKTYSSVQYAVAVIEGKPLASIKSEDYSTVFDRYLKYKEDGLVMFTTFHQSFGYEEFIEGIRPVISSENKAESGHDIEYEIHDGIFKVFCDRAGTPIGSGESADLGIGKNPNVWKVSLEGTGDNPTRTECFEKNHIRIGYDSYGETLPDFYEKGDNGKNILNAFYYKMQIGDIVLSCYSSKTIDAIGVIVGEPEWHDEYSRYKRVRQVNWMVTDINHDIYELNSNKLMMQPSVYKMSISISDVLLLLRKLKPALFTQEVKILNRVFVIDEINRGNISKIFGELITLIEPTKRIGASEQLRVSLPYSGQNFGVPDNVYIIGTMNTADRSIARIDVALRRRFSFVEILCQPAILKEILVDGIDISEMLDTLNKRITVLLDREHTIGHSYFLCLKTDPSIERLATIFENEIIPLLQEYFYDDYEKIQLVLGDNQKPNDSTRFILKKSDFRKLFGNADIDFSEYYEINSAAFREVDAYAFL